MVHHGAGIGEADPSKDEGVGSVAHTPAESCTGKRKHDAPLAQVDLQPAAGGPIRFWRKTAFLYTDRPGGRTGCQCATTALFVHGASRAAKPPAKLRDKPGRAPKAF